MQALRDVPVSSSSSSTMSNTMLKQQRPMLAPQTHRFRRLQVVCMVRGGHGGLQPRTDSSVTRAASVWCAGWQHWPYPADISLAL